MCKILNNFSPNYTDSKLEPSFCIIHYTGIDFQTTINNFLDTSVKLSSHYVISKSGKIVQTVPESIDNLKIAWHAGESSYILEGKNFYNFNNHSVGIELENLNGNVIDYSPKQYNSLIYLIKLLIAAYPKLGDINRILGHEDIAGFRGKIDPGIKFNWSYLFAELFPDVKQPQRESLLNKFDLNEVARLNLDKIKLNKHNSAKVSLDLELTVRELLNHKFTFTSDKK